MVPVHTPLVASVIISLSRVCSACGSGAFASGGSSCLSPVVQEQSSMPPVVTKHPSTPPVVFECPSTPPVVTKHSSTPPVVPDPEGLPSAGPPPVVPPPETVGRALPETIECTLSVLFAPGQPPFSAPACPPEFSAPVCALLTYLRGGHVTSCLCLSYRLSPDCLHLCAIVSPPCVHILPTSLYSLLDCHVTLSHLLSC